MKLTSKVGSLLGMKQRADEPNFGEPLNLEQIAVDYENSVTSPELTTQNIEKSELTGQDAENTLLETATPQTNSRRPSVLDLEFMRSPLDEISLEYGNENTPKAQGQDQINPNTPPMPIETFDEVQNIAEEAIEADLTPRTSEPVSSTPTSLNSSLPTEYLQPPMSAALTQQLPPLTKPTPTLSSDSDKALALSLRSDNETGFAVFGPNEQILEMSETFQQILGLSAPTAANMATYSDVVNYMGQHAELGDKDVEASKEKEILSMRERVAAGIPQTFHWTTTVRSGAALKFSNTFTVNNHLVTTVKNVSDEIEKERILRASLMLGTVGYWTYSFKTGASTLSEYITNKLTDEENSNVKTQGLISIIHPDDAIRVQSEFEAAVQNRTKMDCEFRIVTERQTDVFIRMIGEVELSPSSNEPDVFIAFLNDLTEDRKREKELYAVKEQSKNKSQFLARMSHEIKTPLNAIVGMTEALRDEVDNDEARETASFIADAADNLNNILSQTLEHERLSTSEISLEEDDVNIAEVIKSTVAMWKKPCANKNLKLSTHISNEMPKTLKLDRSRLRQCLTNLLSNAVKFTESGSITLAAAPMNIDGDNPKLLVAVRDTGIGMSAAAIENVFKPFQQGDTTIQRRFGGSGLGMSITQHIVKAMGGHIKIKSVEGEGSTIAITLPLRLAQSLNAPKQVSQIKPDVEPHNVSETAPAEAEKPKDVTVQILPAETFHRNITAPKIKDTKTEGNTDAVRKNVPIVPSDYSGFRVLVVEDNPINQAVVRKLLSNHIASMDFAFHGEEAMQILETKTFDVILMDIHMPVKDGIETTLEIRNSGKAWADTVIVALTADPDYQQKRVCRNIGMNDALAKPVKRQELLDVMQRVLNERQEREKKTSLAMSA